MSTETPPAPLSIDTLAAHIYLATNGQPRREGSYEMLPEASKELLRRLVREAQAEELRLQADHFARVGYRSGAAMLSARADELRLLGGDA